MLSFVRPASRLVARHVAALSTVGTLSADKLIIEKTKNPLPKVANEDLVFGTTFSDHMLIADWTEQSGWDAPKIVPFGNFAMHPATSALHYAIQCFEGMKAYIDDDGKIRMFRPEMNMERLNRSMARLGLPSFDPEAYLDVMKTMIKLDKDWIPRGDGYSLYIRPTAIGTHPCLGLAKSASCRLYTICSPVGPYYPTGFKPVQLVAATQYVRAWPGGTGNTKIGGNYGSTILPQIEAVQQGYSQVLWTFGEERYLSEVGAMNIFLVMRTADGKKELATAPLDGTILPGITRKSILDYAKESGEFDVVSERLISMNEVVQCVQEGRLLEAFGAGTAAVVTPVDLFAYDGAEYRVPLDPEDPSSPSGPVTRMMWDRITGIQYGRIPHEWSTIID
jgi:branched-chain amino acid aminotransferase